MMATEVSTQMIDQLDGTYTYTLNVNRPGAITISVLYYTQGGVWNEYYSNVAGTGTNSLVNSTTTINR